MATFDPGRFALVEESVRCFRDQTHPRRELVIATDGAPWYRRLLARYVASLGPSVRLLELDGGPYTLGAVRNRLLDAALGEIVCQWDDDDLSHPIRLEAQLASMRREDAAACFFNDQLNFFMERRELVWTDWARWGREGEHALIPGTLMMRRDLPFRYPEEGPSARANEDSALLSALFGAVHISALRGAGYLYVYRYHGRNTFSEGHHRLLITSRPCGRLFAEPRIGALSRALAYYRLPSPYLVYCEEDDVLFAQG